jgi:hypothetical protein
MRRTHLRDHPKRLGHRAGRIVSVGTWLAAAALVVGL